MKCDRSYMCLYAITDRTWLGEQTLEQQVEEALKGGITCLQLREKHLTEEEFLREAVQIKELCKRYKVPLFINDNVQVAIQGGADGVHVGQHDMEAGNVRKRIGENMILGVSVHTVEEAVEAEKKGADYLGVGAVFPTVTKADAHTLSHEMVKNICQAVSIPVVAIGGIDADNISKLGGTGVDGVALISAIFKSSSIENTCRELRRLSEKMVEE
ncbi:MAG: thiamine phosphate synthase [Lachnospiraceae bacterium]